MPLIVAGMTTFEHSISATRHSGLDTLRDAMDRPHAVAAVLDMPRFEVKRWAKVAQVYFGPTRFSARQREALRAADGYSVNRLVRIETYVQKIDKPAEQWQFRLELLNMEGSIDDMLDYAKSHIEDYVTPKKPERGVDVRQNDEDTWTLRVRDKASLISQLVETLDNLNKPDTTPDDACPAPPARSQRRADALWELLDGNTGIQQPAFRTIIAIGLDDFLRITSGQGDDVRLGCSNGTIMTGAEWLSHHLAGRLGEDIFAGLFHPTEGPVNLYQCRSANFKQRLLAISEQLVCAWIDCKEPANNCEVHHIKGHKHGGETKPSNLTMLCRYHNGVLGSIDPDNFHGHRPPRGWIDRTNGHVHYHPPGKKPPRQNSHPAAQRGAMHLI